MSFLRTSNSKPYPELVDPRHRGGHWQICDSNSLRLPSDGVVNQVERWMAVPFAPSGRATCRHEMAHVRWSPLRFPSVRFDVRILAAVEDARINQGLAHRDQRIELGPEDAAYVASLAAADAERGDVFAMTMRSVASLGTSAEADLRGVLAASGRAGAFALGHVHRVGVALVRARKRGGSDVAPFASAHRQARALAHALRDAGVLDLDCHARSEFAAPSCVTLVDGHGAGTEGDLDLEIPSSRGRRGGADGVDGTPSGTMRIVEAPLSVQLRAGRTGAPSWRGATEGSVVRYVHRWSTDRAIFRRRSRGGGRRGATVLVDTSGSMSLSVEDLDQLLLATPAGSRVAMYSGSGEEGELRLVAAGRRRAEARHLEPFGIGNIVDIPALEWLAREPGPRLWISDGGVSGVGDRASRELRDRSEAICRRARIRRIEDIQQATRHLAGRAETGARS